jgi:predicted acylesterase/phospholipase RssA
VLSGAVALGSFEAGVVYELLRVIQAGAPLCLDIIVGSSAGSLVGAMAAKCLVTGAPFETIMPKWTEFTLQELTSTYESPDQARTRGRPLDRGVLSSEAVRRILQDTLVHDPAARSFQPAHPAPRIALTMTLTNLDGLPDFADPEGAHRFAEAITFRFKPPDPRRLDRSPYPPGVWRRVSLACRASSAFPGAFDPEFVPWAERARIPNLIEEFWENDRLLDQLDRLDPTIQPKMRYADGGILDEHPVERAITVLPQVTGGPGEGGVETLVYDPHRCFLFVEPDPPATALDAVRAGSEQSWFSAFGRSIRLWTLSASPSTSQRRVATANRRQENLLRFLCDLARRMQQEGHTPTGREAVAEFWRLYPELEVLQRVGVSAGGLHEAPGLIDSGLYRKAVHGFYAWMADHERFMRDMSWLGILPPGRLKEMHKGLRPMLLDLREAYVALGGLDSASPGRYQKVLENVHADLADSLGLAQPWVALQQIAPEDPKQMLKGEGIAHFGGFFSRSFLHHDYHVGRYYAYLWLKEVVPDFLPPEGPPKPSVTPNGLDTSILWQNRRPLWRMAGRIIGAVLEDMGLAYDGAGQFLVRLLGWSLVLSVFHGILLLFSAWFGWVTFPPQYQKLRFWLLLGTSIFPLTVGLVLGLAIRAESLKAVRQKLAKRRQTHAVER